MDGGFHENRPRSRRDQRALNAEFLEFCKLVNLEGAVAYSRMRLKKQSGIDIEEVEARIREKAFMIFLDEKIKSEGNPPSFMLSAARNTLFDYLRKAYRRSDLEIALFDPDKLIGRQNLVEIDHPTDPSEFLKAFSSQTALSEEQLQLLIAFYFEEKSIKEITTMINEGRKVKLREEAIRVRLLRARRKIKETMKPDDIETFLSNHFKRAYAKQISDAFGLEA